MVETDTPAPQRPHITPQQEDLLRIIYLPDDQALPLFRRWYAAVDMQDLDHGCYRLYPQLFKKIRGLEPDNPFLGRLRGNYRKAIYHNRLLFHRSARYIERLRHAGIDCIILKGAALLHEIKHDPGGRPMADVDILIRRERLGEALRLHSPLAASYADDVDFMASYPVLRGEITLFLRDRLELDLHWDVSPRCRFIDDANEPFWNQSREIEFEGVTSRVLSTTDLLFHICVHGVEWNPVPTIRWIANSLDLMAARASDIEWARLVRTALDTGRAPRCSLPLTTCSGNSGHLCLLMCSKRLRGRLLRSSSRSSNSRPCLDRARELVRRPALLRTLSQLLPRPVAKGTGRALRRRRAGPDLHPRLVRTQPDRVLLSISQRKRESSPRSGNGYVRALRPTLTGRQ